MSDDGRIVFTNNYWLVRTGNILWVEITLVSKALRQEMVNSLVHEVDGIKRYLAGGRPGPVA